MSSFLFILVILSAGNSKLFVINSNNRWFALSPCNTPCPLLLFLFMMSVIQNYFFIFQDAWICIVRYVIFLSCMVQGIFLYSGYACCEKSLILSIINLCFIKCNDRFNRQIFNFPDIFMVMPGSLAIANKNGICLLSLIIVWAFIPPFSSFFWIATYTA